MQSNNSENPPAALGLRAARRRCKSAAHSLLRCVARRRRRSSAATVTATSMPIFNLRNEAGPANGTDSSEHNGADSGGLQPSTSTTNNPNGAAAASAADETFPEIKGRVESKLMSMWHNVKYGWSGTVRTNFSKEQPVWLLGRCYHPKFSPASSMESSVEMTASLDSKLSLGDYPPLAAHHPRSAAAVLSAMGPAEADDIDVEEPVDESAADAIEAGELALDSPPRWEEGIDGFRRDFSSRLWMTYRREFPLLNGSTYTSDCGWGCMLRSGQMLLAQALICHFLGRSWRWDPETQLHTTHEDHMHRKIIRWFGDTPSRNSPFSIHTLVTIGQDAGKRAGDWYGPASVSHLLKKAVRMAAQESADFDNVHVYVAQDCTVYIQDILDECLVPDPLVPRAPVLPWQTPTMNGGRSSAVPSASDGQSATAANLVWKALILLVPLRLGTEKLNAIYGNCLKTLLSTEHCIGIIGGRPKHSLYFVGFQEDKLIHLDPHYCQEMVDVNQDNFPTNTFHCRSPRKLKLNKLDPSCCIGFYCQTRPDFERFIATVQTYLLPVRLSPTPTMSTSMNGCLSVGSAQRQTTTAAGSDCAYPMFVFSRARSSEQHVGESCASSPPTVAAFQSGETSPAAVAGEEPYDTDGDESEEFVML